MLKRKPRRIAWAVLAALAVPAAHAVTFNTGDSDLKVSWDTTVNYSTIYRLHDPSATQLGEYVFSPAGDGDRNFNKGVASQRLDLTSALNVSKGNFGGRISATGWYDDIYHQSNDNTSGITHNIGTPADQFTPGTRKAVGGDSRLMDAFVYAKGHLGSMPARITLGRFALVYGETLMSGSNGIAAAQGPIDIVKAATVPGAQVKDFILPSDQIAGTLQVSDSVSLGGYYQFKWEKSPFFPAGSFLSPNDFMGDGAQSFLSTPGGGLFARAPDQKPRNGNQYGAQLHFTPSSLDVDFGLYAARYDDKTPSAAYLDPVRDNYRLVYQEGIRTFGVSASTVIGSDNVSLETSVRRNMPLTGGLAIVQTIPGGWNSYNNSNRPAYAVGDTAHATLVDIHLFHPNWLLKDGGSLAAQYDWHTVTSITRNPNAIDPTTTKSASQLTVAFSADYFQVLDGLDLSIPIVYTHQWGRSRVFVGWVQNGGSLDTGLNFTYHTVWKAGIDYHHFIGKHGTSIGGGAFDQTLWDRDYVSLNFSRTF
ncbi:MAG TPA: DUF1302 family protein [Rhodocyclaceae bacterium]|nr:DUF1302 family protein [Rhodocyclaceae bacterium]